MGKTNKDYCRDYHLKKGHLCKGKDAAKKKRVGRAKKKLPEPEEYYEFKKKEAVRVKEYRLKKTLTAQLQHNVSTTAFNNQHLVHLHLRPSLSRSFHKAKRSLPFSPRKKIEVIQSLAKKFKLRINLEN